MSEIHVSHLGAVYGVGGLLYFFLETTMLNINDTCQVLCVVL